MDRDRAGHRVIVLITGSVEWTDGEMIERDLRELPRGTKIVHGGARGADRIADSIAKGLGFEVFECKADWSVKDYTPPSRVRMGRYGKEFDVAAGMERNGQMLDGTHPNSPGEPDRVLGYQLDDSSGTQNTIDGAVVRGIETKVRRRYS